MTTSAIDDLHRDAFWVCVAVTVMVFAVMIWSQVRFRQSLSGAAGRGLLRDVKSEVVWALIPALILVAVAIPAAALILKTQDMRDADLSIRVTGHQWKWQYRYMDTAAEGISFFSARGGTPGDLEVDHPLVVPSGTKVHLLVDSGDVIHAWYVPGLGLKRSALPGLTNELWFQVDAGKEGIYRGQCAALCGRDHGDMPVVVDVRTPDDFRTWVGRQRAALAAAAGPTAASPGPPPAR